MSKRSSEQDFLHKLTQQLDEAEQALSPDTLRELRQRRYVALDKIARPWRIWRPVPVMAMAMSLAVAIIGVRLLLPEHTGVTPQVEDLQLLSASDDLELYEQLEFIQWLEFEEHAG